MRIYLLTLLGILCLNKLTAQEWQDDYDAGWEVLYDEPAIALKSFSNANNIAREADDLDGQLEIQSSIVYLYGYHFDLLKQQGALLQQKRLLENSEHVGLDNWEDHHQIWQLDYISWLYETRQFNDLQKEASKLQTTLEEIALEERDLDHYDTEQSLLLYMAAAYNRLSQYDQAIATVERSISSMSASPVLKKDELDALLFPCNRVLASSYTRMNRHTEALQLGNELLEYAANSDHVSPNTMQDIQSVVIDNLIALNRLSEARKMLRLTEEQASASRLFNKKHTILQLRIAAILRKETDPDLANEHREAVLAFHDQDKNHIGVLRAEFDILSIEAEVKGPDLDMLQGLLKQLNNREQTLEVARLRIDIIGSIQAADLRQDQLENAAAVLVDAVETVYSLYTSTADQDVVLNQARATADDLLNQVLPSAGSTSDPAHCSIGFKLIELGNNIALRQATDLNELVTLKLQYPKANARLQQLSDDIRVAEVYAERDPSDSLKTVLWNARESRKSYNDSLLRYNSAYATAANSYGQIGYQQFSDSSLDQPVIAVHPTNYDTVFLFRHDESGSALIRAPEQNWAEQVKAHIQWQRDRMATQPAGNLDELLTTVFTQLPEQLVVISSGYMMDINWDVLTYDDEYVVRSCAISRAASFSQACMVRKSFSTSGTFLGYAPFANTSVGLLPKLPGTQDEVVHAASTFAKAKARAGNGATYTTLRKDLATTVDLSMLHLATHAKASDTSRVDGTIYFSSEVNGETSVMGVEQIAALNLTGTAVFLSGCETGVGQVQTGRGRQSLAKAFQLAGAPTLISSQWVAPNAATQSIVGHFYENVGKGMSLDVALQQAKVSYLENAAAPELQHPYYWATLQLQGNADVASQSIPWLWLWPAGLIALVAVIAFGIWKLGTS